MSSSANPFPILRLTISAENPADEARLASALAEIADQNPAIVIPPHVPAALTSIEAWTQHDLKSLCDRIRDEYQIAINTGLLEAVLVETIRKPAEGEGKYIRQTGGHGNYGHCKLRVEPAERGTGSKFTTETTGDAIPEKFIQPIKEGIQGAMEMGLLAGQPMIDLKVNLIGGSYHETDSNETAFKFAASIAFKEAARKASPMLLEPVMSVEMACFENQLSAFKAEIRAHRGRVANTETMSGFTEITAVIPLSELLATSTLSELPMEFAGYEPVRDRGPSDDDPGVTANKPNHPRPKSRSETAPWPPEE